MALDPTNLVRDALQFGGKVRLASLLAVAVPVDELRKLARKSGLTPKGGYRIDKAPAQVLAAMLAESGDVTILDEVCAVLVGRLDGAAPAPPEPARSLAPVLKLKEQELERQRAEVEKARKASARERERAAAHSKALELQREEAARLRAEVRSLRRQAEGRGLVPTSNGEAQHRIHELERELEVLERAEESHRRRVAEQAARVRELGARVDELEPLVPKGRRKKKRSPPPPPEPESFRLPHFTAAFYKSLEGKDRRSIEKAVQAVLLFCTEGPTYPGLEVKQLEGGTPLWSLRASLKLRVFFTVGADGDIDVLALADREDQHTALRRWKDRRLDV